MMFCINDIIFKYLFFILLYNIYIIQSFFFSNEQCNDKEINICLHEIHARSYMYVSYRIYNT